MALNTVTSNLKTKFKISDTITSETGVKIPCITGQVSQIEVVSANGYRYRKDFWDKVINNSSFQDEVSSRVLLGTIEHPVDDASYLKTPYTEASHVVLKAWTDRGNPYATLGLLNNEQGNAIKALIDVGVHPGVSTRGLGDFEQDQVSKYVSTEGYILLGWDIVKDPNFSELSMSPISDSLRQNPLFEVLCQQHQLKDSAYQGYNHANLKVDMSQVIAELQTSLNKLQSLIK